MRISPAENSEGFTLKQRRTKARLPWRGLRMPSIATLALSVCFLLGVGLGGVVSSGCAETMGGELRRYLGDYLALRADSVLSAAVVWRTAVCFFRASAAVFLLGFASIGVALIPAVCAAQGFLYAYSLFCFASGLGRDGFFLLPALFAVRLLVVLPCTLTLGGAAWEKARALAALSVGSGKRVKPVAYGRAYWARFGISCVCLLAGTALELWLVPHILALVLL